MGRDHPLHVMYWGGNTGPVPKVRAHDSRFGCAAPIKGDHLTSWREVPGGTVGCQLYSILFSDIVSYEEDDLTSWHEDHV